MRMIIDYATISPVVLEMEIRSIFPMSLCVWTDLDEDYFEIEVFGLINDLAKLREIFSKYLDN